MAGRGIVPLVLTLVLATPSPGQEDPVVLEVRGHLDRLASPEPDLRDRAEEALVVLGEEILPLLPTIEEGTDPELRWRLERIRHRIVWRISAELEARIGSLWDRFESLPFRRRIDRLNDLARLGARWSLPTLIATAGRDPHPEVRRHARGLAGRVELERRMQEAQPSLARDDFEEAIRIVSKSLEVDPEGPWLHYQVGCLYARAGRLPECYAALERAVGHGFSNFHHLGEDPDLESLRRDPEFEAWKLRQEEKMR